MVKNSHIIIKRTNDKPRLLTGANHESFFFNRKTNIALADEKLQVTSIDVMYKYNRVCCYCKIFFTDINSSQN